MSEKKEPQYVAVKGFAAGGKVFSMLSPVEGLDPDIMTRLKNMKRIVPADSDEAKAIRDRIERNEKAAKAAKAEAEKKLAEKEKARSAPQNRSVGLPGVSDATQDTKDRKG